MSIGKGLSQEDLNCIPLAGHTDKGVQFLLLERSRKGELKFPPELLKGEGDLHIVLIHLHEKDPTLRQEHLVLPVSFLPFDLHLALARPVGHSPRRPPPTGESIHLPLPSKHPHTNRPLVAIAAQLERSGRVSL